MRVIIVQIQYKCGRRYYQVVKWLELELELELEGEARDSGSVIKDTINCGKRFTLP